ncbi:MAG: hypothetical protein IJB97_06135, partial [Clostridia bacterium]|nr:hypothetical protein [Clostridia bacterium]
NLVYTAITRAKRRVILVGEKGMLFMATCATKPSSYILEKSCFNRTKTRYFYTLIHNDYFYTKGNFKNGKRL